jgi:hypothetical protein
MINKMDEQRNWKNVNNEERRTYFRKLRDELKRVTYEAKEGYLESIYDDVMGFQGTGSSDVMPKRTKDVGWKYIVGLKHWH